MANTAAVKNREYNEQFLDFAEESSWPNRTPDIEVAAGYGFPPGLEKEAWTGNLPAQNNLGVQYYLGRNRPQDYRHAAAWFIKAAEEGFAVSQYNLGIMYLLGKYFARDEAQSFAWILKAAEQGYNIAQYHISQCYAKGRGTPKSREDTLHWLKKAALSGNVPAQFAFGKFSTEEILLKEIFGENEPTREVREKINLLVTAAIQGYAPAQSTLGNYYQYGYGFKQNFKEAVSWYSKAAEQGHSRGQFYLANCLYHGIGIARNINKALKWFHSSAAQGDIDAQFALGLLYHNPEDPVGTRTDLSMAAKWYLKAAEQGNVDALNQLIKISQQDLEVYHKFTEALPCFRKAAEEGNADAQYHLGLIYERGFGDGLHYNYLEAENWIRRAAEQGNIGALYHLGQAYERGAQKPEIIKWYYEAAERGHEQACLVLGKAYLHGCCESIKVTPDYCKAYRYLTRASAQRKLHIMGELAICYLCGLGVGKKHSFAIDTFQSLAIRKEEIPPISVVAKMALAKMYLAGENVNENEKNTLYYLYSITDFQPYLAGPQLYKLQGHLRLNDRELFQWLTQKGADGDVRSQSILGLYHFCHRNYDKAKKWYQMAAEQGDLRALEYLNSKL